jgi:hypothetical protein
MLVHSFDLTIVAATPNTITITRPPTSSVVAPPFEDTPTQPANT